MRVLTHFVLWNVGLARAETQTTDAERACLEKHATGRRAIVEVGVWHGVTTRTMRRVMSPEGTLWGVDPFPPGRLGFSIQRLIALREVERFPVGRFELVRQPSAAVAPGWRVPLDLVFIDGDHSFEGLRLDWTGWSPHVAPGGVVALHDSRSCPARDLSGAGSARYTCEHVLADPRFEVVDEVDSLTVLRRR